MSGAELAGRLADAVGARWVVTDRDLLAGYATDWTRRWSGDPAVAVAPADAEQVAAVLAVCQDAGAPVVCQGGNTGLAGGAVPPAGAVVLSTRRMDSLEIDPVAGQATAGAGVPLAVLQAAARAAGLDYGVDLAARDSATVGGTLATNAGGLRVVAYGPTRAQVLGVEAVLGSGEIISRLGGIAKEAVGPDLGSLLIGSEGTLGILTRARLRLVPRDGERAVAVLGVDGIPEALALLPRLRRLPGLRAVEFVDRYPLSLVAAHAGLVAPGGPDLVVVEIAAAVEEFAPLAEADALGPALELTVGEGAGERERLWSLRERVTECVGAQAAAEGQAVHKLDVALPAGRLAEFAAALPSALGGRGRPVLFGHLAEANLHVNLLGLDPDDEATDEAVLHLVARCGGVISSEHGVGRQKAHLLGLSRSPQEIAALRRLKAAFDPAGILNPGALLPA